jgi:hypothetical protein
VTRVEFLTREGQVAGYLFVGLSRAECLGRRRVEDFEGVPGEWVPAGGTLSVSSADADSVGEIVELSDRP